MDTKTKALYMLSTRDPPRNKGHIQTESEGLEKNISHNWRAKKAGVVILISHKIDFKIKAVKRDKEGYYINIKRSADKWVRKLWYIYTMEYYSAIKKNTF